MADEVVLMSGEREKETDICSDGSSYTSTTRKKKKKNKRKRKNSHGDSYEDPSLMEIIKQQDIKIKSLQDEIYKLMMIIEKCEGLVDESDDKEDFPPLPDKRTDDANHIANRKYAGIVMKNKPQPSKEKSTTSVHPATNSGNDKTKEKFKSAKPAPIYVRQKPNKDLIELIRSIVGVGNFYTSYIYNKDVPETKIQVGNEQGYRQLTKELSAKNVSFYTYQLKSEKGLSAVIRGIEPEVEIDDIIEALAEVGLKVKHIHNIRNRQNVQLPLHLVELHPENSKIEKGKIHPIFELRFLLHRKIRVEEPRPKTGPIQCHNCQEFGHTKAYCSLPAVCVVCGDNHLSKDCPKQKTESTAKYCKNCTGNHTANYRGCIVYQHLKNKLEPKVIKVPTRGHNGQQKDSLTKNGLSYANAVAATNVLTAQNGQDKISLFTLMTNMMRSMEQFMKDQAQILNFIKSNHGEED